jgi:hypothetical protein
MYSLVLLAAVAGGAAPGHHYYVADPCPCCVWPVFPMGGRVVFYWQGPAALSEYEEKEWQDYIDALDESDKADAVYYWSRAGKAGKRMLLTQVRLLRADKDKYDAKVREEELKAKLLEEEGKKDDKKNGKKVEKKEGKKAEKKDDKAIEEKKDDK